MPFPLFLILHYSISTPDPRRNHAAIDCSIKRAFVCRRSAAAIYLRRVRVQNNFIAWPRTHSILLFLLVPSHADALMPPQFSLGLDLISFKSLYEASIARGIRIKGEPSIAHSQNGAAHAPMNSRLRAPRLILILRLHL